MPIMGMKYIENIVDIHLSVQRPCKYVYVKQISALSATNNA